MALAEVPLVLILVGLAAYAVLAGADFGAGFWQLLGGRGERGRALREHAHHAMGPVWEANHVWLIFVLVVCVDGLSRPRSARSPRRWRCRCSSPAIGIILRGTAYALRSGRDERARGARSSSASRVSSILTPFALGAAVGGIAVGPRPGRQRRGRSRHELAEPDVDPVGVLAVATAAYLAAVYLAADAARVGRAAS